MQRHRSVHFPLLTLTDEDDESPSDESSQSTPHCSFLLHLDPPESQHDEDLRRRPYSLVSFDSGYFSMLAKDSSISKSCNRKPSAVDLCHSLVPMNDPNPIRQSPKREGVIMTLLRKRKKSMISTSPSDLDSFAAAFPPVDDSSRQIHPPPHLPSPRRKPRDPSVDAFEERDRFVVRQGMKHHPYSHVDAPYMLAYERTLLDNDKFTEILLRRLNHNHSPSFHDFSHAPPRTILDLGCGPGGWAVEAAAFWPSAQVVGFDLLDPVRLRGGVESPGNLQWKQGNFVKYKLPFPKNTFDLVRMANLSLCVPRDRWAHVMLEVRRVLAQGGRLELVDDYMHFPYTRRLPQPSPDSHSSPRSQMSSSAFDDFDDDEDVPDARRQDHNGDEDDDDADDFVSTKSRFSSFVDMEEEEDSPIEFPYDPVSEWNRNIDNSKSLEKLFESMLSHKFSVHPRPSDFLDNLIDKVFGRHNQRRLHNFNLYLAPPLAQESDDSSVGSSDGHGSASLKKAGKDFAKWVTAGEWDYYKDREKRQRTKGDRSSGESLPSLPIVPDVISAKAAGRLGIKSPTQSSNSYPAQSPGLIVWPATFIPVSPLELEMHTCKYLHTLIGCKAALTDYLRDIAREQNIPFDEQLVDDLIWDYESFRRKRFNWPSECPDSRFDLEGSAIATTPRSNAFRNSGEGSHQARPRTGSGNANVPPEPLYPREKLDFVRAIKVYSATKIDEEIHVL